MDYMNKVLLLCRISRSAPYYAPTTAQSPHLSLTWPAMPSPPPLLWQDGLTPTSPCSPSSVSSVL
jgi:hypothetical protein